MIMGSLVIAAVLMVPPAAPLIMIVGAVIAVRTGLLA